MGTGYIGSFQKEYLIILYQIYIFYKVLTIIKCNYKSCNWQEKERKGKDHIVCHCAAESGCSLVSEGSKVLCLF